ncbi:UNKNOWN [Stylonychia lemnae]|uniref:Uncharacterized protein n=1 Tax=Stylonychia lemnae TaxID=5949 RepID=A0A078AUE2_STYLE|nr:UNKNOWN [Stylonychia lemnae]|eukprot:CDW86015.1 UNKNOWN [Stylonychia lemnae]
MPNQKSDQLQNQRSELQDKSKYGLQEFFNDQSDKAKMLANIQFEFQYQNSTKDPNTVWSKLMNVILEKKQHQQMLEMVNFNNNEFQILNRNMPFIYHNRQKSKDKGKSSIELQNQPIKTKRNDDNSHRANSNEEINEVLEEKEQLFKQQKDKFQTLNSEVECL